MVKPIHIIIPILLISGTFYSIIQKLMLDQKSIGYGGTEHKFDKPFTQTLVMLIAMSLILIIHQFWDTNGRGPFPPTPRRTRFILAIPSSLDMTTTTLNMFGLIYINVSIYQMLRSSYIIFCSILSIIFLKRKIFSHEFIGIGFILVALILVGWAGMYLPGFDDTHYSSGKKLLGAILVIIAQIFRASQVVLEEYLLHGMFSGKLGACEVSGNEGIMGLLILFFFVFPLAFLIPGSDCSPMPNGSLENIWDSFLMIYNNPSIIGYIVGTILIAMCYNVCAMSVIAFTSSLNASVLDALRTFFIWAAMLLSQVLFNYGERWTKYSWMQLGGFILLVIGNFIYGRVFDLPFLSYPKEEPEDEIGGDYKAQQVHGSSEEDQGPTEIFDSNSTETV